MSLTRKKNNILRGGSGTTFLSRYAPRSFPERSSFSYRSSFPDRKSFHISSSNQYLRTTKETTILNLDNQKDLKPDFNKPYYENFKAFNEKVVKQLVTEVDGNYGDIIQAHICDTKNEENKLKLMEMFENYKKTYIDTITVTAEHKKTNEGKPYPYFMEDLYSKNDIIFKNFEKNIGIDKKIEDQEDSEFLETLGKRIDGLKNCSKDIKYNEQDREYFLIEHNKEILNYNEIIDKTQSPEPNQLSEEINKHCKLITFSPKVSKQLENAKNITKTETLIEKIKTLFENKNENNKNEIEYAKTFLPKDCWNIDGSVNNNKIMEIIASGDRNYKQYLYGFFSNKELEFLFKLGLPLYNVGGMLPAFEKPYSCSPLVIWSILLNMIYTKCSTYNTSPLCFLRLYLPISDKPIDRNKENITLYDIPKNKDKEQNIYEIFSHNQILDLFDGNLENNAEFIGIITIKYIYNKEKFIRGYNKSGNRRKPEYRIWYLYIFKNNDKKKSTRKDTLTGIREDFFCVSQELYYINQGGLFKKDNITYYELLFFKNLSDKNKIHFYKTIYNPTILFLSLYDDLDNASKYPILNNLKMTKVNLNIHKYINKKTYLTLDYYNKMLGGFQMPKLKAITINDENKFFYNNIISNYVLKSKLLWLKALNLSFYTENIENNYISNERKIFYNTLRYLYNYLLVNYHESTFEKTYNNKTINLTKYKPIGFNFYHIHELFYKYNIFKNFNYNNDTILTIGTNLSFIEIIKFNNYKVKNIKNILTLKQNIFSDIDNWTKYIEKISDIYDIENIIFDDSIYNLINFDFIQKNVNYYKIIYYSVNVNYRGISKYENYYNIPSRFIGILFMLKNLKHNGTFIFNINYLEYKFEADMILIISKFFENYNLFIPEIHNEFKRSGIVIIFENFKGIDNNEYLELLSILDTIKKLYPEEGKEFNIYDKDIRRELRITKPIVNIPNVIPKQITEFLNTNINDKIYDKIKEFTEEINFKKCIFIQKMINILSSPEQIKIMNNTKLPTREQILSSIIYCRKYNIPFNDKYTEDKLQNITSKTILNDMYGIQEPILYKFKTPFQTYITNKIILNPKLNSINKNKSKSKSKSNSISIFKTVYLKSNSHKNTSKSSKLTRKTNRKIHKSIINDSFMNSLFKSSKSSKLSKPSMTSKSLTHRSKSLFKRSNLSLDKALFNSNNAIVQAGLMIDSRKDFTKANPNEDYDNFKEQFRYYRSKGKHKEPNLNIIVQNILGDNSISQAWLKMYEIISESNIVPLNKTGTFKSFHFCEAPGTFINCLNNYVYTKTKFDKFEWLAQSLHPRLAKIKDAYGIIKRHPKNWDWGVDGTGDITNPDNIRYYAKIIKIFNMNNNTPLLMTSDAGLEPEDPKYKLVAYASYVAILYTLPRNGIMIYKIKDSPLDLPLIWNLIYITYTNFKEMYFFKPVQNSQSREFYIIAKDYLGIDTKVSEYLLKQIDKFNNKSFEPPDTDLFDDMYPEEFVVQLSNIYGKLASNYVNSIERIIYYVDNKDLIGKDYIKHIKNYIEEKNEDWIRKYKIKRLDRKKIL